MSNFITMEESSSSSWREEGSAASQQLQQQLLLVHLKKEDAEHYHRCSNRFHNPRDDDNDINNGSSHSRDEDEAATVVAAAKNVIVVDEINNGDLPAEPQVKVAFATPVEAPHHYHRGGECTSSSPCSPLSVTDHNHHHHPTVVAQPVGYSRPEFVFVKVIQHSGKSAGLTLEQQQQQNQGDNTCCRIKNIAQDGLFAKSMLRPGDEVIAVNGISCVGQPAWHVALLLEAGAAAASPVGSNNNMVSVLVHNAGGDPNLVSSSIEKSNPYVRVGIGFRRKAHDARFYMSRIDPGGLFSDTLLQEGHCCVAINGIAAATIQKCHAAAQMVADTTGHVNIVSQPRTEQGSAVVLAREYDTKWWNATAARLQEELDSREATV